MASDSTVGLLEVEPELGRFLTSAERTVVSKQVSVPVATVPRGEFTLSGDAESFAALVLDGMLSQRFRVANRVALRLLGPGDILTVGGPLRSPLLTQVECRAAVPTQLALLGDEVLIAAGRWPRLMAGLHARLAEQSERLTIQLVICQLPRVEDRLLALLWLLAESWGRVTPLGTAVPVSLTHDALGELIGARRSTVTLAVNELTERGAIVKQNGSWLLLETPPAPIGEVPSVQEPRLLGNAGSSWTSSETQTDVDEASRLALRETFVRLQERHRRDVDGYRERLSRRGNTLGGNARVRS
jgi:CRP/FNR family transcriptional regulator, cyclic AMP receptor protein